MPRAIWKGSLSFGLVDIPVSLYSAESREERIRFSLLDRRDMSPVRYERVSERSGKPVPWDQVVRGYEHEKGEYVVVTDDELRRANVEATQTVDIFAFVDAADIPVEHFEKPYHLEPTKRGRKGFALLREALAQSGKVGLAKVVVRSRQQLAALIPRGRAVLLMILRWPHELRDAEDLDLPETSLAKLGVSKKEVEMAERLISGMEAEWEPESYVDTYHEDVAALIAKKVKSGKVTEVPEEKEEKPAPKGGEVIDFMALLQKSLQQKTRRAAATAASKRAPGRKAAPKRKTEPRKRSKTA